MKILQVTTILNTVKLFLLPHITFLIDQGHEVGVASNTSKEDISELVNIGCKVHYIPFNRSPFNNENLMAYREIRKLIVNEGYDLVHVHTPVASFLTRLACRKIPQIKILYTAHGFHFFEGAPRKNNIVYYSLEKLVARWTDGLITMNDEDFCSAKNFALREKNSIFKVNGVGIDIRKFPPQTEESKMRLREQYGFQPDDFILVNVGELSYRKNQDLIIKAVSRLGGKISNLKLLLVGSGIRKKYYLELVDSLGLEKNVSFLGYREDIQELMTLSDIAISSSRQEGLPVNVMEAMAIGLPLIVTDCRGNRDLVGNGKNGIVIDVDNVDACAQAIEKLYYSEELRWKFSEENKIRIKTYSIENVIQEMNKIYAQYYPKEQFENFPKLTI